MTKSSFIKSRGQSTVALFALILSASLVISCKSGYPASAKQGANDAREPKSVHVAQVAEIPVGQTVTVTGALAAEDRATISVKVPGRLRSISVDLGSVVRRGQVIAEIDPVDYKLKVEQAEAALQQARARLGLAPDGDDDRVDPEQTGTVRQARARLDEAKTNRERASTLVQQGVISRAEFDSQDAAFKVAQSNYQDALEEIRNRQAVLAQRRTELALARQQLSDTTISVPFDGMVEEKRASIGEYLAAGAPIVTVVRVNPLRFRGEVPERDAHAVRSGQQVRLSVEGDANIYTGRIVRLSPTISEQNRVLMVEAEVSNNGTLRPGAFARADIVTSEGSMAVTVPTSAVTTFAGIEKVIIVENGKAVEKPVTTGRRGDNWIEILSGVSLGDSVVIDPGNLQSGQPVNVIQ
ncbi:MAG: hypothetical protein AUG51_12380 [Acidobacteria bacterium 13_1_20CM_3_53_8]|nr:MAG: hypothetical protein AUG51_12380 [Acidobacteria bacterium 13_1_20CM_3_53_8]